MHLYHYPLSSNSRRVTMAAHHLGLDLDIVEIDLASADERRRLTEVNPNGKVPTLDDDGFVLWESCAIMQYLADCTPGQTVYPLDPMARADVNRWLFWAAQHFGPAVSIFTWENLWKKMVTGEDTDPRTLARGEHELAAAAKVLEGHLANRQWLCGDAVTLAEYAVAAPIMYMHQARVPLEQYPHIMAWFGRVSELPAWKATNPVW